MDGVEAIQHIRQDSHLADAPIVFRPPETIEHGQQEFMRAGMNVFLPRLFDFGQLYQILDRFLKKKK